MQRISASPEAAFVSAGNPLGNAADEAAGVAAYLGGGDYTSVRDAYEQRRQDLANAYPVADTAGTFEGMLESKHYGAEALAEGLGGRFAPGVAEALDRWEKARPIAIPMLEDGLKSAAAGFAGNNNDRIAGALHDAGMSLGSRVLVRGAYKAGGLGLKELGGDLSRIPPFTGRQNRAFFLHRIEKLSRLADKYPKFRGDLLDMQQKLLEPWAKRQIEGQPEPGR